MNLFTGGWSSSLERSLLLWDPFSLVTGVFGEFLYESYLEGGLGFLTQPRLSRCGG